MAATDAPAKYDDTHTAVSSRISRSDRAAVAALERFMGLGASKLLRMMPLPTAIIIGRRILDAGMDPAERPDLAAILEDLPAVPTP